MASLSTPSNQTTYLITGASQGIGHSLTSLLLQRPCTTVIACIRRPTNPSPSTAETPTASATLSSLPQHPSSRLLILHLDSTSPVTTHQTAISSLLTMHSIPRIHTVLACAGMVSSMAPVSETSPKQILEHIDVNACGVLRLWLAVQPYLVLPTNPSTNVATNEEDQKEEEKKIGEKGKSDDEKTPPAMPKFIVLSSSVGSIGAMEPLPGLAYGMAKCAANFLVRKVAMEYGGVGIEIGGGMSGKRSGGSSREGVIAVAVHPGFVKTKMGHFAAESWGGKIQPPMEAEESAKAVLELVDGMTWGSASGKFLSYDGSEIPW